MGGGRAIGVDDNTVIVIHTAWDQHHSNLGTTTQLHSISRTMKRRVRTTSRYGRESSFTADDTIVLSSRCFRYTAP